MGIVYNPRIVTDGLTLALDAANPKSYTGVTTSVTTTIEDPYADNVSLLLNGNGTNGSTTFTDSSNNSHTVTPGGNAQISTAQSKFGGSSMYFDGSGDYLSIPDDTSLHLGSDNFTFEFWTYLNSTTGNFINKRVSSAAGVQYLYLRVSGGALVLWATSNGSSWNIANNFGFGNTTLSTGQWYHIALVRNGTEIAAYVNGVKSPNTITSSAAIQNGSTNPLRIAGDVPYNGYLNGYIDDFRITKGVARYTSNFTPPAAELYLSTTETQQAPVLTDISPNNNTAILYNGVGYTSSNVGYFTFDGTNNYMEIPYDESVNLTDGDFTIDFWMNSFADQTSDVLVSYGNTSNVGGWAIKTATNKLQYSVGFDTHPAVAGIVTSGLVVHLDAGNSNSYPGSGTTWTDLSGNGNNGTLTNGPTFDSADGGSLSFDGTDDVVPITKANNLGTTQNYTIFTFIYPHSVDSTRANSIVDSGSGSTYPMRLHLRPNSTIKLQHNDAFADPGVITTDTISLNTWTCVAATNNNNSGTVYINGVSAASGSLGNNWDAFNPTVGWKPIGNPSGVYAFDGFISIVLIYNRALTPSEIQRNYNALKGRYTSQPSALDSLDTFGVVENADFSSGITTNTWNHYALVRSGNVYTPYVNAVPGNPSYDYSADLNRDLYFDNASIILNANGDNGSTNIIDSSKNNHTSIITAYNGAGISTAEYKFGGSSLYFDGTNDYIDCGTDSSYAMEDGDFTIEFWMYTDQNQSSEGYVFRIGPLDADDGGLAVYVVNGSGGIDSIRFEERSGGSTFSSASITRGQWNHIAWTRSGSNFYFFVNGTNIRIRSISRNPYNENDLILGAHFGLNQAGGRYYDRFFNGYIDDFIITKGVAKYTSDFTPPNQASYYSNDPNYDNLSILLQGNGTNGSTDIIDSSPNNHTGIITAYSGAGISTAEYKFGGSSLYFDGTDDYIDCGTSDAYSFGTGDFTIEFWHYIVGTDNWFSNEMIFSTMNTSPTGPGLSLSLIVTQFYTQFYFWYYNNSGGNTSFSYTTTPPPPRDTWYHVVWERKNGASLFFINGEKQFEFTQTYTQADYTNNTLVLGRDLTRSSYAGESYIDDFRITKGVAKYTEDFIPPDRTKIQNNQASLKFGASGTNNSNPFNGALSNLKIYKDSLTQSELEQNYNNHKSRYGL